MKDAHKGLEIDDASFDATISHLAATLKELNVD